jgi:hypothetical protein
MKMGAACSSELSVIVYHSTRHHSGDLKLQNPLSIYLIQTGPQNKLGKVRCVRSVTVRRFVKDNRNNTICFNVLYTVLFCY